MEKDEIKELVKFQINRSIKNLYKNCLVILEDVASNKYNSTQAFEIARKKILDSGNDTTRELQEFIDQLDISLKNENSRERH